MSEIRWDLAEDWVILLMRRITQSKANPNQARIRKVWFTVKEFAYLIKRSTYQVVRLCQEGKLRTKKRSNFWLIHEDEVSKFGGWVKWLDR